MQDFEKSTSRAQVHRLRNLAVNVIGRYPVSVAGIRFLHHAENTTFRIDGRSGDRFLLRVHRNGYHTASAIEDEVRWLERLSQDSELVVPAPVRSRNGNLVESGSAAGVPAPRNCTLMRWLEGRFSRRRLTVQAVFGLGRAIASLHAKHNQMRVTRRQYWNAEGLVGLQPKLGAVEALTGATQRQQTIINEARRRVHRELSDFEAQFPSRLGLIHADLHFGNILFRGDRPVLIDFDDSGLGLYEYDLAVPLISLQDRADSGRIRAFAEYKDALLSGYASSGRWDNHSERIIPYLIAARKIAMLGWLQSRSDHPGLLAYLQETIPKRTRELQTLLR
jgi:Ser/Thr protein kinase RdoA (MazF antagonist)